MKNLTKEEQENNYDIWLKNTKDRIFSDLEEKLTENIKQNLINMGLLKEEKQTK
jgi:hypothetical protein